MHEKILTGIILTVMAAALTAFGNGVTGDTGQTQDMDISISADAETDTIQDIRDQETETGDTAASERPARPCILRCFPISLTWLVM